MRAISAEVQRTMRNNEEKMKNNEDKMISIVMREVFSGRNKTKGREMAAGGQRQWSGNVKHEGS